MKLTISHIADHGTIAAAIEAIASDHDSIASGIIGPSFACSGPGSGWQQNYDVSDYAKRALAGDYGAGSYIDSSDGTEATLSEEHYWVDIYRSGSARDLRGPFASLAEAIAVCSGDTEVNVDPSDSILETLEEYGSPELVAAYAENADTEDFDAIYKIGGEIQWSEESVVQIALPTVEECLEHPEAWSQIHLHGNEYGMDDDDLDTLAAKVAMPYEISDGNATEYAATLADAESIIEDWYDFLLTEEKLEELPAPDLDSSDLDTLIASVSKWENEIAAALGAESFAGHGTYYVSAAERAGLALSISIRE